MPFGFDPIHKDFTVITDVRQESNTGIPVLYSGTRIFIPPQIVKNGMIEIPISDRPLAMQIYRKLPLNLHRSLYGSTCQKGIG
jgi:hypothetical protein